MAIFVVGAFATVISLSVEGVYGLFILAADVVFVIVLPQLIGAVFMKWTNVYGAVCGFILGTILRIGAGEPSLKLEPFIRYPYFNEESGQLFPFRTVAMILSLITIIAVSLMTKFLLPKLKKNYYRYVVNRKRKNRERKSHQNKEDGITNCRKMLNNKEKGFTNCDSPENNPANHTNCETCNVGEVDGFICSRNKKNVFRNSGLTEEVGTGGGDCLTRDSGQVIRNSCEDGSHFSVEEILQVQTTGENCEIDTVL